MPHTSMRPLDIDEPTSGCCVPMLEALPPEEAAWPFRVCELLGIFFYPRFRLKSQSSAGLPASDGQPRRAPCRCAARAGVLGLSWAATPGAPILLLLAALAGFGAGVLYADYRVDAPHQGGGGSGKARVLGYKLG